MAGAGKHIARAEHGEVRTFRKHDGTVRLTIADQFSRLTTVEISANDWRAMISYLAAECLSYHVGREP